MMKITIGNVIIELDVEEMEMLGKKNILTLPTKEVKKEKTEVIQEPDKEEEIDYIPRKYRRSQPTKKRRKIRKQLIKKAIREYNESTIKPSINSLQEKYGITGGASFQEIKDGIKEAKIPDKVDYRITRMRFIHSRVKSLIKQYAYTFEKARSVAMTEWDNNKPKIREEIKKDTTTERPKIIEHNEYNKILIDMLGNVIKLHSKLKMVPDGEVIGIENKMEWETLLLTIMKKSKEIATHYTVKDKFQIERTGHIATLTYK